MFPSYFGPGSQYFGHFPQQRSTAYHHQKMPYSILNDQTTMPLSSIPIIGSDPYSTAIQQNHDRRDGRDMLLSMRLINSLTINNSFYF
jgi:hypothetical protein